MKYYKFSLTISVETLRSLEKQLVEKAGQVQELAEVIVENEETGFLNIITGMARIGFSTIVRFGRMSGEDGKICKEEARTGLHNLASRAGLPIQG